MHAQTYSPVWDQDANSMLAYIKQCYNPSSETFNWNYAGDQAKYYLFLKVAVDVDAIRGIDKDVSILDLKKTVEVAETARDIFEALHADYSVNIQDSFDVLSELNIASSGDVTTIIDSFENQLKTVYVAIGDDTAQFGSATDVENFVEQNNFQDAFTANYAQAAETMGVESSESPGPLQFVIALWDVANDYYNHIMVIDNAIANLQESINDQTNQNIVSQCKSYEENVEFGNFVTALSGSIGTAIGTAMGHAWGIGVGVAVGAGFMEACPLAPVVGAAIGYVGGGVLGGAAIGAAATVAAQIITSTFVQPLRNILDNLGIPTAEAKIVSIFNIAGNLDLLTPQNVYVEIQDNDPVGSAARTFVVTPNPSYWTLSGNWILNPQGVTLRPGQTGIVAFEVTPDNIHVDEKLTFNLWNEEGMLWWTKEILLNQQSQTYCDSPPEPVITKVNFPSTATLGSAITFDATSTNTGCTSGWQTIAISFPVNQPLPTQVSVLQTDLQSYTVYAPGETVTGDYSNQAVKLQTYLIEGLTDNWQTGGFHHLEISVTPSATGTFDFYVKSVAGNNVADSWVPDVNTYDAIDQQGEYAYVFSSSIVDKPVFPVTFSKLGLAAGTSWTVTLGVQHQTVTSDSMTFNVPTGGYSYSITPPSGYTLPSSQQSNSIDVASAAVAESLKFTAIAPPNNVWLSTPSVNGLAVNVNGGASPIADVSSVQWNWGDGSAFGYGFPGSHTYQKSGTYPIIVTVNYFDGSYATDSTDVTVSPISFTFEMFVSGSGVGSVSYSYGGGSGTISSGQPAIYLPVSSGMQISLTAIPQVDSAFAGWSEGSGVTLSGPTSLSTVVTTYSGNGQLIPYFVVSNTVVLTSFEGGSVSYSFAEFPSGIATGDVLPEQMATLSAIGGQISLKANPIEGYTFASWETNGPVAVSDVSSIDTTVMVNGKGGSVIATFTSQSDTTDPNSWPMFQNDLGHSGYSSSTSPTTNNLIWRTNVGQANAPPIVVNGILYLGSINGNFFALNATTGSVKWAFDCWPVWSSAAFANGIVYLSCEDGNVYALNSETGAKIWNYLMQPNYIGYSSPVVSNGIVYVGSFDDYLYALSAASGALLWKINVDSSPVYSSPAIVNGIVYISSCDGVCAFNGLTGAEIWSDPSRHNLFVPSHR